MSNNKYNTHSLNHVSQYFYFMWNRWNEVHCYSAFAKGDARHLWNKWGEVYGSAERFWAELSEPNRDILLNYIIEYYNYLATVES